MPRRDSLRTPLRLVALAAMALAFVDTAQAQIGVTQDGDSNLSAINSGQVTLNGTINNPIVNGQGNNGSTLDAKGAQSAYSIQDVKLDAQGDPAQQTAEVHVTGINAKGSNSGTVTTNGTIAGGTITGANQSQTISATGMANTISIRTTGK